MQKNRRMYIEELVNKTISYYEANNICHIEKRNLPIKIVSKKETKIEGHLNKKSFTDFFGLIDGKYIDFESKQTNGDNFSLSLIKEHQIKHIIKINSFKHGREIWTIIQISSFFVYKFNLYWFGVIQFNFSWILPLL